MGTLFTPRLELVPFTLGMVEAVYSEDRAAVEDAAGARLPEAWPGKALVERAFTASLEAIRADPAKRLWGDRLMILRDSLPRRLVGSVVFHGRPDEDGIAEIGYGVEQESQRNGYATEAVCASIDWALTQPGCRAVRATTFPWHRPSLRVIEKSGMRKVDSREHEVLGELLVFEICRGGAA